MEQEKLSFSLRERMWTEGMKEDERKEKKMKEEETKVWLKGRKRESTGVDFHLGFSTQVTTASLSNNSFFVPSLVTVLQVGKKTSKEEE